MKKPIIGIVPLVDCQRESLWMLPGYMEGIQGAGGLPVMLPLLEDEEELGGLLDICSGILFTGGQDVDPRLYQEEADDKLEELCPQRDGMESVLLKEGLKRDLPMLGICRGIQIINACLGGSLYQDIPREHPSQTNHHQGMPYEEGIHEVCLVRQTPLADLIGRDRIRVNSLHHQAVKRLAPSLVSMAEAPDGIIEAVYRPGSRFLWAVQWHPEFSWKTQEDSRLIFGAFVEACRKREAEKD